MIKLGRITMYRFTAGLEPFGIRPRHVAALIELRDTGELTQQALCGHLHLDPTNLVEISDKGVAVLDEVAKVMDAVEDELLAGLDPAERAGSKTS